MARGGENDSWYHLKCKITGDVKEKLDKELKIVIREQSASSATIEVCLRILESMIQYIIIS